MIPLAAAWWLTVEMWTRLRYRLAPLRPYGRASWWVWAALVTWFAGWAGWGFPNPGVLWPVTLGAAGLLLICRLVALPERHRCAACDLTRPPRRRRGGRRLLRPLAVRVIVRQDSRRLDDETLAAVTRLWAKDRGR